MFNNVHANADLLSAVRQEQFGIVRQKQRYLFFFPWQEVLRQSGIKDGKHSGC